MTPVRAERSRASAAPSEAAERPWSGEAGTAFRRLRPRPRSLDLLVVLAALAMAAPLGYLLVQGLSVAPDVWGRLLRTRVPLLLGSTLTLAGIVTLGALGLGLLLAWLVERTDLPGRRIWRPLLLSPLVIPCYVIALLYVSLLGSRGILEKALSAVGLGVKVPAPYGLGGAAFVLVLATYPFVYAIARAALRRLDPTLIEAARCCGAPPARIFFRGALPLLAPALSAGGVLALLCVLSDFGVVTAMRYPTFVTAIYQQIEGSYSLEGAAALSVVLIALALALLGIQNLLLRRRVVREKPSARPRPPVPLGLWKGPAFALALAVVLAGFVLPLGVLLYWLLEGFQTPPETARLWGAGAGTLLRELQNSFGVSALAASAAVGLALPLAYWAVRMRRGRIGSGLLGLAQAGQALPGVLVALGVLFVVLRWAPALYATVAAVVLAYLVRFFPQALQAARAGLAQTSRHLEESARLLGEGPWGAFRRVTLPLLRPALVAGWTLVFIAAVRELPATLLLRPAGFETLPVRIWTAAGEGLYGQAAPAALLLVAISVPLLVWLHRDRDRDRDRGRGRVPISERGVRCHD